MDRSGVRSIREPSAGDWKLTPSSVISASFSSDTIWNPPLSVFGKINCVLDAQ